MRLLITTAFLLFSSLSYGQSSVSQHLTLGNPSRAGTAPNNYLMVKKQYALSYNKDKARPNWVSWRLAKEWLGDTPRQDDFRADPSLPDDFPHAIKAWYAKSGYDCGHLCPSDD